MSDVAQDALRSAHSAFVSLDTAVALLEKPGSPTLSLNYSYTANRARTHLRNARTEARKAEELLALIETEGKEAVT